MAAKKEPPKSIDNELGGKIEFPWIRWYYDEKEEKTRNRKLGAGV